MIKQKFLHCKFESDITARAAVEELLEDGWIIVDIKPLIPSNTERGNQALILLEKYEHEHPCANIKTPPVHK